MNIKWIVDLQNPATTIVRHVGMRLNPFSVCYNGHITTFIIEWRINNFNASKERALFLFSVKKFVLCTKAQNPEWIPLWFYLKLKSLYRDWCRIQTTTPNLLIIAVSTLFCVEDVVATAHTQTHNSLAFVIIL